MKDLLKRIFIFAIILGFISLYVVAIIYAFKGGENATSVIVGCFATIGVLSIFIGVILRYIKYKKEQNQ